MCMSASGWSGLVARQIDTEMTGHLRETDLGLHQVVDIGLALTRDRVGLADDHVNGWQDQAIFR